VSGALWLVDFGQLLGGVFAVGWFVYRDSIELDRS
jgi:hypothetical protein